MNDNHLRRIAEALERLSPPPQPPVDLSSHPAYHWDGKRLAPAHEFRPLPADLIVGVNRQKADIIENSRRHASGAAAHDVLLWGARGMGKSALVKSVVAAMQEEGFFIALVEAAAAQIEAASTHWLRHTAGTHMTDAGLDVKAVRDNFGHATISTTSIYVHSEDAARHDATQAAHKIGWTSAGKAG